MKKWIVTCNCNQKNTNTPPEIITVELEAETYEDAVIDGVKEIASRITKSTTHAIESIINNEIVAVNVIHGNLSRGTENLIRSMMKDVIS